MRVLADEESTVACRMPRLNGRRLIVQVSLPVSADACIAIACEDALLLGEVLGTYHEGELIFAVIEMQEAATGLRANRRCLDDGLEVLSRRLSA